MTFVSLYSILIKQDFDQKTSWEIFLKQTRKEDSRHGEGTVC